MDGCGRDRDRDHDRSHPTRNFSHFLRPSLLSKSKLSRYGAVQGEAAGDVTETGVPENRTCGPCDGNIRQAVSPIADRLGSPGPNKRFQEPSSLMMAPNGVGRSRPQGMGVRCNPYVPVMSSCSQGGSNDPMVSPKRRYKECRSSSQSHSDGDDSGRFDRAAARTKDSDVPAHRSSQRNRRGRINKKFRALQELLPNCNELDQLGVLDEAIKYLTTLQQQLLVLSTGSPMYMSPPPPPPPMLPAAIQHMYVPYPGQFPMTSVPREISIGAGPRLPIPPVPRTAGLGLQQPMLPFAQPPGSSSAWSLSRDCSQPTDSSGDLVDTSDQSDSSGEDEF